MNKLLAAFAAAVTLTVCAPLVAAAKPQPPATSFTLDASSQLELGGTVTFTVGTIPKADKNPGVSVQCWAIGAPETDPVIYGALQFRDEPYLWTSFVLGGGSSHWLEAPQPAHCRADLLNYDLHGVETITTIAGPVYFEAGA